MEKEMNIESVKKDMFATEEITLQSLALAVATLKLEIYELNKKINELSKEDQNNVNYSGAPKYVRDYLNRNKERGE